MGKVHIDREHKVGKTKINKYWNYMGEADIDNPISNIGIISSSDYKNCCFSMYERVKKGFSGEGMAIIRDDKNGLKGVGYSKHSFFYGPNLTFGDKNNIFYNNTDDQMRRIGFNIEVRPNGNFYIKQYFEDEKLNYRGIAFENGILYFEDIRRNDNRFIEIYKLGNEYKFLYDFMMIRDYKYSYSFIPSKVIKHHNEYFTFSGAIQTSKEGNEAKYEYDFDEKKIKFKDTGNGYAIKYYTDDNYYFGHINYEGRREGVACYKKGDYECMGNWEYDDLKGPAIVKDKTGLYFCSHISNKKHCTYFQFFDNYLLIRNATTSIVYKVYLNSFDVEKIDTKNNSVVESKIYPFEEDDEESLNQLDKQINAIENPQEEDELFIDYEGLLDLADFNYVKEDSYVVILSSKKKIVKTVIPSCAHKLAPRAFSDKEKCENLEKVTIRSGLIEIGEECFMDCSELESVVFDKCTFSVIKDRTFKNTGLKTIDIPESVKKIGKEAFADCKKLYRAIIADDCKYDPSAFPEWCEVITISEWENGRKKRIRRNTSKFWNFTYKVIDRFKGKKKKELPPGYKEEKTKKSRNKKIEKKKKTKSHNSKSLLDILISFIKILALPFVYIGKGFVWLFKSIGKVFSATKDSLASIEITKEHILMAIPIIFLIAYIIFGYIYGLDKIVNFNVSKLAYDKYDWELSGAASNWMENTDHNFFTALTLGLIQIITIVLGFVVDIILTIIIFILGIIVILLGGIIKFLITELLPVVVIGSYLVMLKMCSKSNKGFVVTCICITLFAAVLYYLGLANVG